MQRRTLNLVLALLTGRVWEENPRTLRNKSIDIWDCREWVEFVMLHFLPWRFIKEVIIIDRRAKYILPRFFTSKKYPYDISKPRRFWDKWA
jgi:hypothetical protein